ncbi:hypothetical protein KFK09_018471 [Dendrobium nobile]|uniref:Retrovirus-related Pol polyprotein from transposon TNT 1-94 n=1 Tax=Dendrobium nobile TaxID=94219 RepID=A0A8T3AVX3_DENNO|nr:hypothetical protein KFK09_018471 [Dendrobium nobile]
MIQYLNEVKTIVDQIAAAGSTVDNEDIILYILNGLSMSYQSFKTYIRTMQTPLNLDQLYPLLISEELHLVADNARATSIADSQTALFASRGRGRRPRSRPQSSGNQTKDQPSKNQSTCQICLKRDHIAMECWHRFNQQYTPKPPSNPNTALLTASSHIAIGIWIPEHLRI